MCCGSLVGGRGYSVYRLCGGALWNDDGGYGIHLYRGLSCWKIRRYDGADGVWMYWSLSRWNLVGGRGDGVYRLCGGALRNDGRGDGIHLYGGVCGRTVRRYDGIDSLGLYRFVSYGTLWRHHGANCLRWMRGGAVWRGYGANSISLYRSVRYWTLLRGGRIFCDECAVSCWTLWGDDRFIFNDMYGIVFGWILL